MADKDSNQDKKQGSTQDSNQDSNQDSSGRVSQKDTSKENLIDNIGRPLVFGRGMESPDSTEAVLDASTGEEDPRARGEGFLPPGDSRESDDTQSAEKKSNRSGGKSGGSKMQ